MSTSFTWKASKRNTNHKHSDILSSIAGLLRLRKLTVSYKYIPAHQDEKLPQEELTRMAKLNIMMDTKAKAAAELIMKGELRVPQQISHPLAFLSVSVHNRPICHLAATKLYECISDISIHEWWLTKNRYQVQDIPSIHWGVCSEAANSTTKSNQRFASKWVTRQLGTGNKMKQWRFRPHDSCPFCLQEKEDTAHVLLCQHDDAISLWNTQIKLIEESLSKWETEATLQVAICEDLQAWRQKNHLSSIRVLPTELQRPILDMRRLGVLEGLLPKLVIEHQDGYFKSIESNKTGKSWGKRVYKLFWSVLKALWAGRNDQLHNTNRINDLQGLNTLKQAIRSEYGLGLHRLPACEFSIYFSLPIDKLLSRDMMSLKAWLQSIRLGRDLHGGIEVIQDEYSVNGAFQSWLGLPDL